MQAGNSYPQEEDDDHEDYEPMNYFRLPPRGSTTVTQDDDVISDEEYEDIVPVRSWIKPNEIHSQNASQSGSSITGHDTHSHLGDKGPLLSSSVTPSQSADKTPPPIPPKKKTLQRRAATIARIYTPQLSDSSPSVAAHLEPRYRESPDVEPRFRGGPDVEPRFRGGPDVEPRFRHGTDVEPRFRHGTDVEPHFRGGPDVEPRFRAGPDVEPRFRHGTDVEPHFRAGPDVEPRFRHGTDVEPHFRGGPDVEPRFRHGTDLEPRFRASPDVEPRFRGGPDSVLSAVPWSSASTQLPKPVSIPLPPYDNHHGTKKTSTPEHSESSQQSLAESAQPSVPVWDRVPRSHSPVNSVSTFKPLVHSNSGDDWSAADVSHHSRKAPRRSSAPHMRYNSTLPHSPPTIAPNTRHPDSSKRSEDQPMQEPEDLSPHEYTEMRPLPSLDITTATVTQQPTIRTLQSQLAALEENGSKLSKHTAGLESNLQQSLERLIDHQRWMEGEISSLVQQVGSLQSQLLAEVTGPGLPRQEVGGVIKQEVGGASSEGESASSGFQGSERLNQQYLSSLDAAQVLRLLAVLGLEQYAAFFRQHQVDGEFLLECSDSMLRKSLRMTSQVHRLRLLKIIRGHRPVQQMLKV